VFHLASTHLGRDTQRQIHWSVDGPSGSETPTLCECICDCEYVVVYELCVYVYAICVFFVNVRNFKKQNFLQFIKFVMSDGLASAVGHKSLLCLTA
jgi:hypothetical protein